MMAQLICQLPSAQFEHCICKYMYSFFFFFLLQVAAVDFPEDVGTIDLSAGAEKVNTMKWSNYVRGVCRELQEVCECECDCVYVCAYDLE